MYCCEERRRLDAELKRASDALEAAQKLCREALPKFNWSASCLDANAIRLLNDVPCQIDEAIAAIAQFDRDKEN